MRRLVLFCDESIEKGDFYSNFFGAALVEEKQLEYVNGIIRAKLVELHLKNEVKFSRITANYQAKYQELMVEFFKLIASGHVKIRIMFTQNNSLAVLTSEQRKKNRYFLLYYQLIKHSFGWQYMSDPGPYTIRMNFDVFPQTKADIADFKNYLVGLTHQTEFKSRGIIVNAHDIAEVESHKHEVLQCLDIIMGSIQCKLNEGHKTKAGETTNFHPDKNASDPRSNRWTLPYKHWKFAPKVAERNAAYVAKNK